MAIIGIEYESQLMKDLNIPQYSNQNKVYIGLIFKSFQLTFPYFDVYQMYVDYTTTEHYGLLITSGTPPSYNSSNVRIVALVSTPGNDDLEFANIRGSLEKYNGFTLFTASMINTLTSYSTKIAITRKVVQSGIMVYHPNAQSKHFGLRMEGNMTLLPPQVQLPTGSPLLNPQTLNTGAIAQTMGNDCPPYWEMINYL